MGEVQKRLVEDDDLPGPHARAEFAGAEAVVFAGDADDGEAGQEGLQIQAEMALGGRLAPPMFGPVHTAGDELNGGGVHEMNGTFETEGGLGGGGVRQSRGGRFCRWPRTAQNRSWASWAGRSRLAVGKPFLLGPRAPRRAESGPECRRKASQTSLRPRACVSWAKIKLTT